MTNQELEQFSVEDCIAEYEKHFNDHNQGYYKVLETFNKKLSPYTGKSPFSKEGWQKILERDDLFKMAVEQSSEIFHSDPEKQKEFKRLMKNTRDTAIKTDMNGFGLEGWGGGNAVYASSLGAFAMGTTPFIIGGWLAATHSEEIFQRIDNKNSMRLEFEYNIDYLMIGDEKYFFPQAFRSGQITGYNKLPQVDWVTPNTSNGTYTAPETWCGEDMFILFDPQEGATASVVKGNLLEVSKRNKHKYGIEPNCTLTAVKYKNGNKVVTKRIHLYYDISTGTGLPGATSTNTRIWKSSFVLKNVEGASGPIQVQLVLQLNLDNGDFTLFSTAGDSAEENAIIKGFQFNGKVSNIANELTNIPTVGIDKYQFIRECEYRNYSKVSLNEYMADNFRIGSNNNIQYAAYATDKNLQWTVLNRAMEAEDFLIEDVLDDGVDLDSFELTRKMGGFINNNLSFTINRFLPGLHLQDYKEGLKTYLNKVLATAETELNVPASVKREWIFLGYDALVTEFPEIKYENAAVALDNKEGGAANENYGFSVYDKCAYTDSLGRAVRIIANNDARWRDRGNNLFGAIRTFSMEYPFLVYYPHAIRMFTAIDADNPNRTAIIIGGREFRGHFAAGAVQLALNGVMDEQGNIINNFDSQMANGRVGYEMTTIEG